MLRSVLQAGMATTGNDANSCTYIAACAHDISCVPDHGCLQLFSTQGSCTTLVYPEGEWLEEFTLAPRH